MIKAILTIILTPIVGIILGIVFSLAIWGFIIDEVIKGK